MSALRPLPDDAPLVMTVSELARRTGLKPRTLRRYITAGTPRLPAFQPRKGAYVVHREEFNAWLTGTRYQPKGLDSLIARIRAARRTA